MHSSTPPPTSALRLLECWLPLAQFLNQRYGWHADAATLEQLILAAAPALQLCAHADEAHLLLFITHSDLRLRLPA